MRPDEQDAAYLWDMLEAATAVRRISAGVSLARYETNEMLRMAVERGLEIIGEAAGHVSGEFRAAHPEIPWRRIVAQRNVLAHAYGSILNQRIWQVVTDDLPELIRLLEPLMPSPPPEAV